MSTATVAGEAPAAPKQGKKKLIIIIALVVLLLAAAGVGALLFLKKQAQAADEDGAETAQAAAADEPKVVPTFVPLDPFTVNLADREAERYAQIGVTFAVEDSKVVDSIKVFMPAIRNNILMVLAHKTSAELLQRDGKEKLASDIKRETARALGHQVDDPESDEDSDDKPKKKRKKGAAPAPIKAVYFSNFIVQ